MDKLIKKYDSQVQRALETLPGFLTWGALTSPVWLGRIAPLAFVFFLTFLAVFWVYRALIHTVGVILGYRKYQAEIKENWLEKCRGLDFSQLPNAGELPKKFKDVKHIILIPMVNENLNVLKKTFGGLAEQNYPKENILVVAAIEERGAEKVLPRIEKIKEIYQSQLPEIWTFVHPKGIPGEAIGAAAANRTWGGRGAVERLQENGADLKDYIFTTFDADGVLHPQFIARLTYEYLVTAERNNRFFSTAVFLFNNNLWEVPVLMRMQANGVTLGSLSSWVIEKRHHETFSAYSVSLPTVLEANYWDVKLGVDDTPFFWQAFFAKEGNFEGQPFFVPINQDAVQGENFIKSHVSQYKQLLRWGWGAMVIPTIVKGFLTHRKVPKLRKLTWAYNKVEQCTIWKSIVFLITFGFGILGLVNPDIRQKAVVSSLPEITGLILTFAFLLLIPATFLRNKIIAKVPADWPWWRKALSWIEGPMVVVNLLTFSFIPFIDAETRMMLGKKIELYYTPKFRSEMVA